MSDKSVAQKMQMKPGHRVLTVAAPKGGKGYAELVGGLPEGARLVKKGEADFVHLFVLDSGALARDLPAALAGLGAESLLWISYPKQTSGVATDLNRDVLWKLMVGYGWEPVMQIAVDETWSALRFKKAGTVASRKGAAKTAAKTAKPATKRAATKKAATKAARAALPEDLAAALDGAPEARERFEALSPSHRREYLTWIEEAKKPETRARRVAGTIEKLVASGG